MKPLPSTIPALNGNPVIPRKIDLGKALFFNLRLSALGVLSCASCPTLTTGGDDTMAKAIQAFEATLLTPAPFDAWPNGDDE